MTQSNDSYICCFGEVLWDVLPSGRKMGGAPMNVAAHLKQLGIPSVIISRVGHDEQGNEIKKWLVQNNFPLEWVQTDSHHITGVVHADLTDKSNVAYDIVQPVAWDFISITPSMLELVRKSQAIVYGTLACRNLVSRECLFTLLDHASLQIFDVNLRSPHYSRDLAEALLHRAHLVKMNDDELHRICGWYGWTEMSDRKKMEQLKAAFHIPLLLVTRGGNGAMVLNDDGFFEAMGFKVQVADTIGSGDAFLAGFLKMFTAGKTIQHALHYACAVGALVAMQHGAIPAVTEDMVQRMLSGNM